MHHCWCRVEIVRINMPVKSVSYSINHNAGILEAVHHMTKQFWIKEEGEDELLALNSYRWQCCFYYRYSDYLYSSIHVIIAGLSRKIWTPPPQRHHSWTIQWSSMFCWSQYLDTNIQLAHRKLSVTPFCEPQHQPQHRNSGSCSSHHKTILD